MNKAQHYLLEELLEREYELTDFERQFVDKLDVQRPSELSQKQDTLLNRIYQRVVHNRF